MNLTKQIFQISGLLFLIASGLHAQNPPRFTFAGYVNYLGDELFNKHGNNPILVDWNGNGNKDLVVGIHYEGQIYVYTNTGESEPIFNTPFVQLKADSERIYFAEYT